MTPQNALIDPRLRKLQDLLAASINKPAETTTPAPENQPTARPTNISIPPSSSTEQPASASPPTPNVDGMFSQMPRIRVGSDVTGLTGAEKEFAKLKELRENPRSNIDTSDPNFIGVNPPKLHHGFKDALKSIGRTAVLAMGQRAAQGDDSTAGLLSAGATGGAIGGFSPNAGDEMLQGLRIKDQEMKTQRALELEKEQAQVQNAGMVPVQLANGQVVMAPRAHAGQLSSQQQPINERGTRISDLRVNQLLGQYNRLKHYKRGESPSLDAQFDAAGLTDLPEKDEAVKDTQTFDIKTDPSTGDLIRVPRRGVSSEAQAVTYGNRNVTDPTQVPTTVTVGGRTLAVKPGQAASIGAANERQVASEAASNTRANRQRQGQAAAIAGKIKSAQASIADLQQKAASDPQHKAYYDDLIGKQNAILLQNQTALDAFKDVYDENGPRQLAPNPQNTSAARMGRRGQIIRAPAPTTHNFSIGAYIQRNPGATEADARAFAEKNYKGYNVVP